jgi:hypothetical protein
MVDCSAHAQRMLESDEFKLPRYADQDFAVVAAADNGHVEIVDCLLRHAMFDPSLYDNRAIRFAAQNGHLAETSASIRRPTTTTTTPCEWLLV